MPLITHSKTIRHHKRTKGISSKHQKGTRSKPRLKISVALIVMAATLSVAICLMLQTQNSPKAKMDQTAGTVRPKITAQEPVAFYFGTGRPNQTYTMHSDQEAIITLYWNANTWASIEHFRSKVYANEATILELEEPDPGIYPLRLDTGEVLGSVRVE